MDWQLIDDHVVTVPASAYVLEGLPGDDEEYLIVLRQVCGGAGGGIAIRPNNDDVPGHYGYQQMQVVGGDMYPDDRIVVNRGTTSDLIALLHLAEGELGFAVGIGADVTNAFTSGHLGGYRESAVIGIYLPLSGSLRAYPTVGYHFWAWCEYSAATGITTWLGEGGTPTLTQSGISGSLDG